jgi:phasin
MIMAIPRKPKPIPVPEPAAPTPDVAIAEALAPVEVAPPVLAAMPAPMTAVAETATTDLPALIKGQAETAMAEAKAAQERLRVAAEQGLEQTRAAYAKMKAAAEEATSSLESSYAAATKGWTELNTKALAVVKDNASAHFEHVKAVIAARSMPEVINLQTEHFKSRMAVAGEQIKDLTSTAQKLAADAGEPLKAVLSKRFAA